MFSFVAVPPISFFEDLCFLNPWLKVVRDPGGNGRFEPPHYVRYIFPIIHMGIASAKNLDRLILPLVHLRYCPLLKVLEMNRGRPSSLSGRENKVFADRLMGRDTVDRTSLRVKTRARFKGKISVVSRPVSLV